jgi:PEP-CTERM motif-containing protein
MKTALFIFLLSFGISAASAQGEINFINGPATLFTIREGSGAFVPPEPGTYYFALLTAPAGTTDPLQFTFSGVYATNFRVAGFLFGGNNVAVPGWMPGTSRSFLVAGWTSSLGHDWNQDWLTGTFNAIGYFSLSSVGMGPAGGFDGPFPYPPLNLFGGATGIQTGLTLTAVPEPSTAAVVGLGVATLALFRRGRKRKINGQIAAARVIGQQRRAESSSCAKL